MNKFIYILALFLLQNAAFGQNNNEIKIPLSSPDAAGKIKLHNHNGEIQVVGYDGDQIILNYFSKVDEKIPADLKRAGLKRIPNNLLDITISERHNEVQISPVKHSKRMDFIVKVPYTSNLELSTHHNGNIYVENVTGEVNLNAHHGSIEFKNISGSVVADTHHGFIKGSFSEKSFGPIAFTTYHGDIDIEFPNSIKATAKIKSSKGDIFTDFDLTTTKPRPVEKSNDQGNLEIKVGEWVYADINAGGEEFMFSTYHGDVLIRQLKN